MPAAHGRLTAAEVKREAARAGFDLCGIAPAESLPELGFLREWLDAGHAGEMHYLERSAERRMDVRNVLPSARSVIVFGTIYNTDRPTRLTRRTDRRPRSRATRGATTITSSSERDSSGCSAWLRAEAGDALRPGLRGYRTGPGARLRAARRARLDRQEHLRHQRRTRLLDLPVGDSSATCRCCRMRLRSTSAATARSASTPARQVR